MKKGVFLVLLLMLLAVVTKVIGCGLGAKIMRYTNKESLQLFRRWRKMCTMRMRRRAAV